MTEVSDAPITQEEMIELFGETMPMEALSLIWRAPEHLTLRDIRRRLREIAAEKQAAQKPMIERMAEAYWNAGTVVRRWHEEDKHQHEITIGRMRAAVEALREPTDGLREIMGSHASNGTVNWTDYHDAMINAVLETW